MVDLSTALTALFGGGVVTGVVQAGKFWSEERARKRNEAAAGRRAPLLEKSLEMRLAEQATAIQQRMIDDLEQGQQDLRLRYDLLRSESEREISELRAENTQLKGQVAQMHRTISEMAIELRTLRGAGGP